MKNCEASNDAACTKRRKIRENIKRKRKSIVKHTAKQAYIDNCNSTYLLCLHDAEYVPEKQQHHQEKYSWESVDYKHDYKMDFGKYVQVYAENNITNIMKARTLV